MIYFYIYTGNHKQQRRKYFRESHLLLARQSFTIIHNQNRKTLHFIKKQMLKAPFDSHGQNAVELWLISDLYQAPIVIDSCSKTKGVYNFKLKIHFCKWNRHWCDCQLTYMPLILKWSWHWFDCQSTSMPLILLVNLWLGTSFKLSDRRRLNWFQKENLGYLFYGFPYLRCIDYLSLQVKSKK